MAVITRIEIVNYLSEGWKPGMGAARWRPLWPANTLRLAGQSTAIQIPNGCGKTSVTNAILFLLSRDRKLKKEFLDRCAPVERGYTHIRIEFGIGADEDLAQHELMTRDPLDCPTQTYVIGVCANRGEEDLQFYRHAGMLEDSPAYRLENSNILFTSNEDFRSAVKKIGRSDWNRWGTIADWGKVVGEFMSREVVRQNVAFHLSGAGDASATFKKVAPEPGERFDEAYFKQVVAPQLLSNLMGESAEEDERAIEDTITISMTRFIDAKLKVEQKAAYLERRRALEAEFEPVLGAAIAIEGAQLAYQGQLSVLGLDAAFFDRFAGSGGSLLLGMPLDPKELHQPAAVKKALRGMAVDKDGSLLISDSALAELLGLNSGHVNQLADRSSANRPSVSQYAASSQVLDFNCDIKILEGAGGRRKPPRYYDQKAAWELASRRTDGMDDSGSLQAAFETAEKVVDTNPFRREHRRMVRRQEELKALVGQAEATGQGADQRKTSLETQVTERADNQTAYQEFCKQAFLFPSELQDSPQVAEAWLEQETLLRTNLVTNHSQQIGVLTAGWKNLQRLRMELGYQTPAERWAELEAAKGELDGKGDSALDGRNNAKRDYDELVLKKTKTKGDHDKASRELETLSGLQPYEVVFRRIFGEVDPLKVFPPVDELRKLQREVRKQNTLREPKRTALAKLNELATGYKRFLELFGDVDPRQAKPEADLGRLIEQTNAAQLVYGQHLPLAEAYEQYIANSTLEPKEWIRVTDEKRVAAERRRQAAAESSEALKLDLASLEDLAIVGDVNFAAALEALDKSRISYVRLQDFILQCEADPGRRLSLLTAFGAVLSAPVVDTLELAESAMLALKDLQLEVPILLSAPLLAAIGEGELADTDSGSAVAFFAGIRTRRVRAIVDPQALEEEKQDVRKQIKAQEGLEAAAATDTLEFGPHSDAYSLATQAHQALLQNSVAKTLEADKQIRDIEPMIERARDLCTRQALRSIADAIAFADAGGKGAIGKLATEVAAMDTSIEDMDERAVQLEPLTTQEAVVAHDGAARYARGGGTIRLTELQIETQRLQALHLEEEVLGAQYAKTLNQAQEELDSVVAQAKAFLPGYESMAQPLQDAILFEKEGHAAFMQTKDEKANELKESCDALKPAAKINFVRAQSYKDHQGQDDAQLQLLIGKAIAEKAAAEKTALDLIREAERLLGLVHAADRSAESLHELVFVFREKHVAAAPYLSDLAQREGGASPPEAHALYARTEELRHRLANWRNSDGPFDRNLLAGLRSDVEDIDIAKTGSDAREAKKQADRVRENFSSRRTIFCEKAAATDLKALSQAEIESIQAANTVEELKELVRLGERLQADLAQEKTDLLELQVAAGTVETESIGTLTRLVQSCHANLETMNQVMSRNPKARFFIATKIISDEDVLRLMHDLRDGIEARKRTAQTRSSFDRRNKDDGSIKADVRRALIDNIFIETSVEFRHVGMWEGDRRHIQDSFSEGQKAAMQMLWLIKESEYHLECAIRRHLGAGSKKRLRARSQRILFFDGLFSNLTDRALIDEAFKGLGDSNSNLQLIGLIHNPEYRNNPQIFPALVIGRRAGWRQVDGERSFMRFEDGRPDGSMGMATFMFKRPKGSSEGSLHG